MHLIKQLFLLYTISIFPVLATPTLFEQAQTNYEQGHFVQAIRHYQALLNLDDLKISQQIQILIQLSRTYQALGLSQQALTTLLKAESLQNQSHSDTLQTVKLLTTLSDLYLAMRENIKARHYANKSLKRLPPNAPLLIRATVLNNLANVLTVEAYYTKAIKTYSRTIKLAEQVGETILIGRALINKTHAHLKNGQWHAAANTLTTAQQQFESLEWSYAKAYGLISLGNLAQHLLNLEIKNLDLNSKIQIKNLAYQTLNSARNIAEALKNPRLISYAYGFLGQLYETTQRYPEALQLTRQAIFHAKRESNSFFTQQNQASEILYRWQWQLGRLFKAQHKMEKAINALQSAVKSLQPIRQDITIGYRNSSQSFRERVGPIYFELADLLLQRAARLNKTEPLKEASLKEALETIERFKTAELQDYFQDECLIGYQSKRTLLNKGIAPHTAVIYPILLEDRTEILLNLSQGIQQFIIPITANQLKEKVNEFRFELETHEKNLFLPYAKYLYRWLIAPLLDSLSAHHIDTLIIIPDGVLRTIPFAALHDDKHYLISKYAIVTMPGLTLTEFNNHHKRQRKILLSGLSNSVQGHSALYSIPDEIKHIAKLYDNVTQLLNQDFTLKHFSETLKKTTYSILHIASHGEFEKKSPFLLTYDGKLTINQLEALIRFNKRRQEPLDLLTLSACQTAVGDDQAALGLAGIALKAGAKSALASLWSVNDKATSLLMKKFYQEWQKNGLSKVKALQAAQQYLLKQPRFQHPAYWASFLLIGSWK
ncbi:MAG: CHAT domain-containing protein [Thiomargarita sp.]|nr:CHAT domain-containing protein [Thiomargarita sp.]